MKTIKDMGFEEIVGRKLDTTCFTEQEHKREPYEPVEVEIIVFENEDVIVTSGERSDIQTPEEEI